MSEESNNINEQKIQYEKTLSNSEKQVLEIEQNLIEHNKDNKDNKITLTYNIGLFYCIFFFVSLFFILSCILIINGLIISLYLNTIIGLCLIVTTLPISIFIVKCWTKKVELIKDESNHLLLIKGYNPFGCEKYRINIYLENLLLDLFIDPDYERRTYHLYIINTLKNTSEIDLDKSTIRNKPIKFYYLLKSINLPNNMNQESLCNFFGCPPEFLNPILRDNSSKKKLKDCIRMSDNFISCYFNRPSCNNEIFYIFFTLMNFILIIGIIFSIISIFSYVGTILGIISSIISVIGLIFLHYWIIAKRINRIRRIDIIYSTDFDRMFIGLVKYYEKSYKNTYIFDINSLDKFVLESYKNNNEKYILKIIFKNQDIQDIDIVNIYNFQLDGILSILNERLNKNKNCDNKI